MDNTSNAVLFQSIETTKRQAMDAANAVGSICGSGHFAAAVHNGDAERAMALWNAAGVLVREALLRLENLTAALRATQEAPAQEPAPEAAPPITKPDPEAEEEPKPEPQSQEDTDEQTPEA